MNKGWPHLFGFIGKCKGSFRWRPFQTETAVSLLSHDFWISVVHVFAVVVLVPNCACWISLLTLVFIWLLGTRWSSLHGMGVATSWWACTHLCDSLNKSLGWIIPLILRTVVWSFGCRLNSFGHVSRRGVLDNIYLYHLAIIWLVSPRMLEFIEETLPKFTKICILCAI